MRSSKRPCADRLGGDEVHVGVDATQVRALLGDLVAVEVAERGQHVADPVEGARHGVGAVLDPALEGLGVALQLEPALGPPGVVLALGALVARVRLQVGAQPPDLAVGRGVAEGVLLLRTPAPGASKESARDAQRVGELTALRRVAPVERLGDPQPPDRLDRDREVHHRQAPGLPVGGHDVGPRLVAAGPGVDHDGEAAELPGGHLDHVAGAQPAERRGRLAAPVLSALTGGALLEVGDPCGAWRRTP